MIKDVAEVLFTVQGTSGYNNKLCILKKAEKVPGLKEVLKFIYNPYCKTGISDKKIDAALTNIVKAADTVEYHDGLEFEVMDYFKTHQTGTDADVYYAVLFILAVQNTFDKRVAEVARAIVTQKLKIGTTATSLNAVYGKDFIPKVGCMLGTPYGDVGPTKTAWPCIVTEKLDGIRRILIKERGVVKCYSRSGHEDTGLVDIIAEAKYLPDNTVYDGELLAAGTFKDNIALRQATNSIANSGGPKHGLIFNVFDMLPVDEFYSGQSKTRAVDRKILLAATLKDENISILDKRGPQLIVAFGIEHDLQYIKPVPILGKVGCIDAVTPIVEDIWARGGEGVMLNTVNGLYEIKRSKQLLKVKHTEEHTLKVVDVQEGTGKYEDALGALIVEYNGALLGVGSGFTDAQRIDIWNNASKYIGRKVEIETFGESTNAAGGVSLNCPIFKRFVGEVE